jgi:prolyl oligopeptidase
VPRKLTDADAAYRVVHVAGRYAWVYTDRDAPRRRVVTIDLEHPDPERWRTVVPESDTVLTRVSWFGDRLVTHGFENVHSVVRVFEADGRAVGRIPLPGTGVVQVIAGSAASSRVSLLYSGLLQPPVVLVHDLARGTTATAAAARDAPDLGRFEVRQEWFRSRDGTRVPMFVVARRGLVRDGSHPTILHGYGASGNSVLPYFSEDIVAWLQMGGVYAIANLRGGGEFGKAWYEAAIRERKQTTFDDFIAASEHLVAGKWTSPRRLGILGASNGGLLVAAPMLQRPELYGAVLADVPVTDALRRHLSGNGPQQVDQWGTPDDPAVFAALRAYSPVHNVVEATCYPATLVSTSRDDDRMPPWHAYKFTAALQAAQGCDAPILLHVRGSGGHGGGDVGGWLDLVTRQLVFAAESLGLGD